MFLARDRRRCNTAALLVVVPRFFCSGVSIRWLTVELLVGWLNQLLVDWLGVLVDVLVC